MKKIENILEPIFVFSCVLLLAVCIPLSIHKKNIVPVNTEELSYAEKQRLREIEHENNIKKLADSTVSLSFYGVSLGEPFKKTIAEIKNNNNFHNVTYANKDKTVCRAKVSMTLPSRTEPLLVDLQISSYQDTITSFIIASEDYDTHYSLIGIFKDKYNTDFSTDESEEDDYGDNLSVSGHESYLWTFKNQSIRVSNFYEEKKEYYIKDPTKSYFYNRYGIKYNKYFKMVTIIYIDLEQEKKIEEINKKEKEKQRLENEKKRIEEEKQKLEKKKQDSIMREKISQQI